MTCYNMDDTLEVSLLSILNQIDETFEIIFVDDGSTDNSYMIAKKLAVKFKNLRVFSLPEIKTENLDLLEMNL